MMYLKKFENIALGFSPYESDEPDWMRPGKDLEDEQRRRIFGREPVEPGTDDKEINKALDKLLDRVKKVRDDVQAMHPNPDNLDDEDDEYVDVDDDDDDDDYIDVEGPREGETEEEWRQRIEDELDEQYLDELDDDIDDLELAEFVKKFRFKVDCYNKQFNQHTFSRVPREKRREKMELARRLKINLIEAAKALVEYGVENQLVDKWANFEPSSYHREDNVKIPNRSRVVVVNTTNRNLPSGVKSGMRGRVVSSNREGSMYIVELEDRVKGYIQIEGHEDGHCVMLDSESIIREK